MRSQTLTQPLKVALLLHLAPRKLGSMEAWLKALALGLRKRRHSVTVYCRDPVHPDIARALSQAGVERRDMDQLRAHPVRGILRLRRFDVVHLNFVSPLERSALMSYWAWPARVLVVDHISRDPGAVSSGGAAGRRSPFRTVKRRLLATLARQRLTGVAAVSNYVRSESQRVLRLPGRRMTTIYNGVDIGRFHPDRRQSGSGDRFTVVCVAHLIPAKGVDYLLQAAAALGDPRVHLSIVGDGPERTRLEALAADLGIGSRTLFLGLRDDVDELLRRADIFVHPAVWGEAFGLTITEAMASGCPVVATDVGGIPELVEHGTTGLLVPPRDIEALARAISRLIDEPGLREGLSARARARAVERFDLDQCVAAHVAWCEAAGSEQPWDSRAMADAAD